MALAIRPHVSFRLCGWSVNDELGALRDGLEAAIRYLRPGGRLAVITFHSLEDRIVKNFCRETTAETIDRPEWPEPRPNPRLVFRAVTRRALQASADEQKRNPRSRSAKLRAFGASGFTRRLTKVLRSKSPFLPPSTIHTRPRTPQFTRGTIMNANTKRHSNHLQCAAILRGVIITAFLAVAGLSYVYLKNQLHNSGTQRRALEQELTELINKNNALETQIAGLTSRTALQKRLDEGFYQAGTYQQPSDRTHSSDPRRYKMGS